MSNVRPIRNGCLTPEIVAQSFAETAPELDAVFIVGFFKGGERGPVVWSCGDLSQICTAATVMQDLSLRALNGVDEVDE